jgi:hypothetical protein
MDQSHRVDATAAALKVYDNSLEADPHAGRAPQPTLVLHLAKGKIMDRRRRLSSCPSVFPESVAGRYNRSRERIEGSRESSEDCRRTTATQCGTSSSATRAGRAGVWRKVDRAAAKDALILVACRNSRAAMQSINDHRFAGAGVWLAWMAAASLVCLLVAACAETPTQPRDTLPTGRWTGDGACLSVAVDGCDLVAGCGHGQFAQPDVHADGTFAVSGTYRIEVGPVSINPAPPAMFSGVLKGQTLTLTVMPGDPSLRSASYVFQLTDGTSKCAVPCV